MRTVALTQGFALPRSAQRCQAADVAAGHLTGSAVLAHPVAADLGPSTGVVASAAVVLVKQHVDAAAIRTKRAAGGALARAIGADPVVGTEGATLPTIVLVGEPVDALATADNLTIASLSLRG